MYETFIFNVSEITFPKESVTFITNEVVSWGNAAVEAEVSYITDPEGDHWYVYGGVPPYT